MDALAQLVGQSPGLAAVRDQVRRLLERQSESRRMPPVLIQGETGSGKGLVARAMHAASARANGPFVDVNCAAIPETLLEAEMFGVERGAFTDARQAKPGLFQLAHRGTMFLDEIGLLPEALQAKLLKAIEERAVRRLGGTRSEPVDVWVIAATNEDLVAATRDRRFRADLYHRLAVVTLSLPPLRERGDDVVRLAEHFLARACADYGMAAKTLTPAAKAALCAYPWPGNVRELSNVMERVTLLGEGAAVTPEMLVLPAAAAAGTPHEPAADSRTLEAAVDDVEREHLLAALRETDWNVTRAAMRLGISRNTLRYRIEKHGLRPGVTPPRRRVSAPAPPAAAPTPASVAAPSSPAPAVVAQRERRRLALMRVALTVPPGLDAPFMSRRALELLSDKARAFGGHVEELTTSGVVAAFGVEPVEDAPVRAANAALAIVNGIDRARRAEGLNVSVKAAIHVDHFVVASAGRGPAIDMDARPHAWAFLDGLLDTAEPEGIVASEAAMPFLERRFDLLAVPAPGRANGRIFRLAGRERLGIGLPGRSAAFVGRYHELQLLRSRLDSAVRGQGQVIGIAGEAGMGKSRLLYEFRRSLAGQPVAYVEGRCHSYATSIPYTPVLDLVRAACRIVESDTPEAVATKIGAALRDIGMDPDVGAPHLLHLLGVKEGAEPLASLTPDVIKPRVLETLRQFMVRSSLLQPLILVVEDLHWVDAASEECLASLADAVVGACLLMVSTYRPGYRPPWIERSYATQMALQPLDADASKTIVRSALGSAVVDDAVVDMILLKGEGNAFFLEELARAVGELGGAEAPLGVPATVREVLLARIDRLSPVEKHVLQCAAVVGKDAALVIVRAIAGLPEDTLQESLARLRAAELLYETSLGPEAEFSFKHALTHEVAYESVPDNRRRELHAAIAQALERLYADRLSDHVERLAHHAFHGELWNNAARYLRQAGAKAAARSAHREAVAAYERALLVLRRLPDDPGTLEQGIDVRFDLRTSLTPLGEHRLIFDYLREAERLAETLGDQRRLARVSAYMAEYSRLMGDHPRAANAGRRALDIADRLGDLTLQVAANIYLGQVNYDEAQYRQAAAFFRRTVELLGTSTDMHRLPYVPSVHGRSWLVLSLAELGEFREGIATGEEGVRIAEVVGQPLTLTSALGALGWVYVRKGELGPAVQLLQRALDLAQTWKIRLLLPQVGATLGLAYVYAGRPADAAALLERAVEQHMATRGSAGQSIRMSALSEAYLARGSVDEATAVGRRALELARQYREPGYEAYALRALAEAAQHSEPPDTEVERRYIEQALALANNLGMRPLAARCLLGLAITQRRAGAAKEARASAEAAAQAFGLLEMPFWIACAQTALSRLS